MSQDGTESPRKGPKPHKGTPEDWIRARSEYEGGGGSIRQIAEKYGLSYPAARKRCSKQGWRRGDKIPEVQQRIYKSTQDMLVELGMPTLELLKLLVDGAKCTKKVFQVTRVWNGKSGRPVINPFTGAPATVTTTEDVVDNETTFKYRQQLVRILGLEAAPKMPEAEPPKEGQVQRADLGKLSDEELDTFEALARKASPNS